MNNKKEGIDETKINATLGSNIKLIRTAAGLTGAQFAESLDVSIHQLSMVERGTTKKVDLKLIKNLADKYNTDLNKLFKHNMSSMMLTNKLMKSRWEHE